MSIVPKSLTDLAIAARAGLAEWIAPVPAASTPSGPSEQAPILRSLSPKYNKAEHGGYVEVLSGQLVKTGPGAPLNIALTGHYGSGKSSVLIETHRRLETQHGLEVINLSLPSLGVGEGRIPQDGDPNLDKTNLIQKEIVKQLLYRRRPTETPASRYNRLDTFDRGAALRRGSVVGVFAAFVALVVGLPGRLRTSLPSEAWVAVDGYLFSSASEWIRWSSLVLVFALAMSSAVWLQRLFQQRLRVTELAAGAGPATVKLSEPTSSYFDEYLDEIVYFFQTSRTAVVIFEDLDRFKDPHIFETLRELNLLLNNAEQTGEEPIRFVYAIRDSIFEQLSIESSDGDSGDQSANGADIATQIEVRRLITTNRTKFFDLVVPMVPFISHRTSRDLMNGELAGIPDDHRPSRQLVDLVSAHITDMRLIKNICNEFDIFRTRILRDEGLKELTPDKLFASIVYKNLFLADYENIRNGASLLDGIYGVYRQWVTENSASARVAERRARNALRRVDSIDSRSERLGARLQGVLTSRVGKTYNTGDISVVVAGESFEWANLKRPEFWRAYLAKQDDIQVNYPSPYPYNESASLSFEKVQLLLGERLHSGDWENQDKDELRNRISAANSEQLRFAHASMQEAIKASDDTLHYEGDNLSLGEIADRFFIGSPIVVDLIREGFIDENFTLYVTQFPGESSAAAMNFIIKSVQPNIMDIEYHFGTADGANDADIEAALASEGPRILNGESVFNRELFDHLLLNDPESLYDPIRRLAARADEDLVFIDAYTGSGKRAAEFVRILSASWAGIFDYLLGPEPEVMDPTLLDAALSGVVASLSYKLTDAQRAALVAVLPELSTITSPQTAERSKVVATVLGRMNILVPELKIVAARLRDEVVGRSMYPVTRENLEVIMGAGQIALDAIEDEGPDGVYSHVQSHLAIYLAVISEDPAIPSVFDPSRFGEILADTYVADEGLVEKVAELSAQDCVLVDVSKLDSAIWTPVLRTGHFASTAHNVAAYIDKFGVDDAISAFLASVGAIKRDQDEGSNTALATSLLNSGRLTLELRIGLVVSLGISAESIDVSELTKDGQVAIPELVRRGFIADDAEAFTAIQGDAWQIKYELLQASNAFDSYMSSLELTTNDLLVVSWDLTPSSIKAQLIDNLSLYSGPLGKNAALALAKWAHEEPHDPGPEGIELLAAKAGYPSAVFIVGLLGPHAPSLEIGTLKNVLNSLGGAYAQLTTPGRKRPKVPSSEGVEAVLERLRAAGIVSKFHADSASGFIRVSKHHS